MQVWKLQFKERGRKRVYKRTLSSDLSREQIIKFYGLSDSDVEWYNLKIVNE